MSAALISTCVGGRRAGAEFIPLEPKPTVTPPRMFGLTARQQQIVRTVIRTGSCVVAANVLRLSKKTVEFQMARIREVVDVDTNYQLIAAFVAAELKEQQQ